MKHSNLRRLIGLILAIVMVVGMWPSLAIPANAVDVSGTVYAGGVSNNSALVLKGDTTLVMTQDLTIQSISGDYDLTIQGSGKLTVNGSGNGIDVKSLNCSSDLFIQTGWHAIEAAGAVYINNAESFIVGGIYAAGHIDIQCSNATIGGNDYAITSALGSITLSGGTFDIGANGDAVSAQSGEICMNGDFRVSSNNGGTIDAAKGAITVEGSLIAKSPKEPVWSSQGFSFYGTTLNVEGNSGIHSDGDISITATSTTIITNAYSPILGDYVYIDSDYLFLQNLMEEENHPLADWAGISSEGDVSVISNDATIVGKYGINTTSWYENSEGNLDSTGKGSVYLTGNFHVIGSIENAILCSKDVTVEGSLTAQGSVIEQGSDNPFHYGICPAIVSDNFSFKGTTLEVKGYAGLFDQTSTDIEADSVVITTDVDTALRGDEIYVTANSLWVENKATKADSAWWGQHGISVDSKLALTVKNGTVIGYKDALHVNNSEFEFHYIYVDGGLTVVSKTGAGMYVPQGVAECYGGPIVSVGETYGIYANDVYFDGNSLRLDGNTGIYAKNSVELNGEDVQITAFGERNSGIWCENGYVDLEGKVTINTNGWYGINAGTDLSFHQGYYEISGPEGSAQAVMVGGELSMDGTLEIVKPTYGHVNGNNIYGAGDAPAMEVLIYSAITEVSLYIDGPREGRLPTWNASGVYFLDPRCTVEDIVWYEDGVEMSRDAKFIAGRSYSVKITISADGVYHFVEGVMGKVNEKAVSTGTSEKKTMYLTADMGKCPNCVDTVELTIKAPVEGNTPSTAVTDPSSQYGVYSRDVRWTVSTDGINFYSMASGEKFVGGKYYRVFMDVNLAGNAYKFPITTADGTVQPDVVATVNGSPAVVEKAYDQDPETVITVYYDFGKCNDSVIEEITIVDVIAPVAGQHPSYTANMFGTGYHIDTTKNSYEDIYWKNPPEKWYYVKNGVQWWDTTTGSYEYVYENDTFIPGHTYSCTLYVRVDDGFTFARENGETLLTATINGNTAQIVTGWTDSWNTRVTYTFTCEMPTVSTIQVHDIDAPKVGNLPDYTATLAYPDLYQLDTDYGLNSSGIYWYDCEGRQLEAGERFGGAGPYRMAIKFVPTISEGMSVSEFADEVDVFINGKPVNTYGQWDNVVVGSGAVWAFYTFTGYSSAPEQGSFTISGDVTSYGDGTLTLELIPKNQTTPISMGTFDSNGSYCFSELAVGVYTLRVSKPNHVTREYVVVVTNDVVQDVEINLIGDANIDGKVNMKDWSRLYNHISEVDLLSDYGLSCADVNQDGKINMKDWARLYAHISEANPLW